MEKNICRLCFDEKNSSIGLFTAQGFLLGVASAIRLHFLDEVKNHSMHVFKRLFFFMTIDHMYFFVFVQISEDDIFPKFVCTDCWTKLADFHDFYNAVDEARDIYLKRAVKEEVPSNITESNGDAGDCDIGDNVSVKSEPMDFDVDEWEMESQKLEEKYHTLQSNDAFENIENDYFDLEYVDDECETQNSVETRDEFSTSKVVVRPINTDEKPSTNEITTNNAAPEISEVMNMSCFYCNFQFKTLSQLIKHFQSTHNDRCIKIRCCDTNLKMNELLEHMEYHKNPDKYK